MIDIQIWRPHPTSLVHCRPDSAAGRNWLDENVHVDPWQREDDGGFVVETVGMANAIYSGAICDGLTVQTIG